MSSQPASPQKPKRVRLALAITAPEMREIAEAVRPNFPDLAHAIDKQRSEIQDTGVNVWTPFQHQPDEPIAGLSDCPIVFMRGVRD